MPAACASRSIGFGRAIGVRRFCLETRILRALPSMRDSSVRPCATRGGSSKVSPSTTGPNSAVSALHATWRSGRHTQSGRRRVAQRFGRTRGESGAARRSLGAPIRSGPGSSERSCQRCRCLAFGAGGRIVAQPARDRPSRTRRRPLVVPGFPEISGTRLRPGGRRAACEAWTRSLSMLGALA